MVQTWRVLPCMRRAAGVLCRDTYLLAYMASLDLGSRDIAYSNLIQAALMRTVEGFAPNYVSSCLQPS